MTLRLFPLIVWLVWVHDCRTTRYLGYVSCRVLDVRQVEIVFPVASDAMTATGEQGQGDMKVVPGVSGEGIHPRLETSASTQGF